MKSVRNPKKHPESSVVVREAVAEGIADIPPRSRPLQLLLLHPPGMNSRNRTLILHPKNFAWIVQIIPTTFVEWTPEKEPEREDSPQLPPQVKSARNPKKHPAPSVVAREAVAEGIENIPPQNRPLQPLLLLPQGMNSINRTSIRHPSNFAWIVQITPTIFVEWPPEKEPERASPLGAPACAGVQQVFHFVRTTEILPYLLVPQ